MVTKRKVSEDEYYAIENEITKRGYMPPVIHEYIKPAKNIETDINCPVCDGYLILYLAGLSYQIKCKSESCLNISVRGL